MNKKINYVCVDSAPEDKREVNIEFLSFSPEDYAKVEGATVKVKLEYNKAKQKATLWITAIDEENQQVIFDEIRELCVNHIKPPKRKK